MDETARIKRERTDFMIEIKRLREMVNSFTNSIENNNIQFLKLQRWARKVTDIM